VTRSVGLVIVVGAQIRNALRCSRCHSIYRHQPRCNRILLTAPLARSRPPQHKHQIRRDQLQCQVHTRMNHTHNQHSAAGISRLIVLSIRVGLRVLRPITGPVLGKALARIVLCIKVDDCGLPTNLYRYESMPGVLVVSMANQQSDALPVIQCFNVIKLFLVCSCAACSNHFDVDAVTEKYAQGMTQYISSIFPTF